MATFITSKAVGETIEISVDTSTQYWKYNHNGTDSSVFEKGQETITVANANGEFTIIPCSSNGTVSGDLTYLVLQNNQLTSFTGTGLSALISLRLADNQLTSFDGTGLSALTDLRLNANPLTTFIGGDMGEITELDFTSWNITTLESFDISGMDTLQYLYVNDNPLTPVINNALLTKLAANELANNWDGGELITSGGRTSAGTTDYDYLIANNWNVQGADLVPTGTGKLRVKGVGQLNP